MKTRHEASPIEHREHDTCRPGSVEDRAVKLQPHQCLYVKYNCNLITSCSLQPTNPLDFISIENAQTHTQASSCN